MACSSTIFINGVFVLDERIRNNSIVKLHRPSMITAFEPTSKRGGVAVRPQAMAPAWW